MLRGMDTLPAAVSTASPFPSPCPSSRACPSGEPHDLRLLLVDDCRINRMLVTAVLARWGIVPTIACNGAEAVILASRQRFDIVLMDMLMPVMDGVVATAKIRQAERESPPCLPVPIVAYTSLDLSADAGKLAVVGLSAVLPKPCSATSLGDCLAHWRPDKFARG
jgi:CheY-like chemotaxis protein